MLSNKAAIAAVGLVGLVGAAGAGAFIANQRTRTALDAPASTVIAGGVEATEATVEPLPAAAEKLPPATEEKVPAATDVTVKARTAASAPAASPAPRPAARESQPQPRKAPVTSTAARNTPAPPTPARGTDAQPSRPAPVPAEQAAQAPTAAERVETPAPPVDTYSSEPRQPAEHAASTPPAPRFDELTVPAEAVIGLQLESTITSESARVEDRVEARVTRDVRTNGRVAIPSGSRVLGSVSLVERGGKMRERARLGVRFHTIVLADGSELPVQTETVYREGEAPGNASAAKVGGGAIGGAILGAILGGGKGAAIGAGVGAGAGTAAVMAGGRRQAEIRAGSPVTVKVLSPVTVTVER